MRAQEGIDQDIKGNYIRGNYRDEHTDKILTNNKTQIKV